VFKNIWDAFTRKKKVTSDDRALALLQFASKFTKEYVDHELKNQASPFKVADRERFLKERLIVIFWLIDKFLADPDRKLTAAIHQKYFEMQGLLGNPEGAKKEASLILSRYKEYYSAWNEKSPSEQLALAAVIANNILGGDEPILAAGVTFPTSADLLLTLKALIDFSERIDGAT